MSQLVDFIKKEFTIANSILDNSLEFNPTNIDELFLFMYRECQVIDSDATVFNWSTFGLIKYILHTHSNYPIYITPNEYYYIQSRSGDDICCKDKKPIKVLEFYNYIKDNFCKHE